MWLHTYISLFIYTNICTHMPASSAKMQVPLAVPRLLGSSFQAGPWADLQGVGETARLSDIGAAVHIQRACLSRGRERHRLIDCRSADRRGESYADPFGFRVVGQEQVHVDMTQKGQRALQVRLLPPHVAFCPQEGLDSALTQKHPQTHTDERLDSPMVQASAHGAEIPRVNPSLYTARSLPRPRRTQSYAALRAAVQAATGCALSAHFGGRRALRRPTPEVNALGLQGRR